MNPNFPILWLARHGETAWSLSGQHTGMTDLPLTERGERNARCLGERLGRLQPTPDRVLTSPLQRARRTCELCGMGNRAMVDPELVEWDYGQYEGRTSAEIAADRPDWDLFRDGCPGGESPTQVADRADRVIRRLRSTPGNVLVFSSGHFIRVLASRWVGLPVEVLGRHLLLDTASLSSLGYDRQLSRPVLRFWNDTTHLNG